MARYTLTFNSFFRFATQILKEEGVMIQVGLQREKGKRTTQKSEF